MLNADVQESKTFLGTVETVPELEAVLDGGVIKAVLRDPGMCGSKLKFCWLTQSLVLLDDGIELITVDPLDRDDPDECELRLVIWVEFDLTEDPLLGIDLGAWFVLKFGVDLCTV